MKKAVIFDMDGVIVDSEPLWQIAEHEVFSSLGVVLDKESCKQTQALTTMDVTKFWYAKNPWEGVSLEEAEQMVISKVKDLIVTEDCKIPDVKETIESFKNQGVKIGLATNSTADLVDVVLEKVGISNKFDAKISADMVKRGKPDPDIYLTAIKALNESAADCFAIEDSNTGILAAKRAGLFVIAFSNNHKYNSFEYADYVLHNFLELDLQTLFG